MATIAPNLAVDEWDLAVFHFEHGYSKTELSMTPCTIPERSVGILGRRGSVVLRQRRLVRRTFDGLEEVAPRRCRPGSTISSPASRKAASRRTTTWTARSR